MKHFTIATLALTALTVMLAGCNQSATAVTDTREADTREIRALENDWLKGATERNADKVLAYYADDAVLLWPDASTVSGKAAIAAVIKDMLQDPNLAYSINLAEESMEIAKSGDLAYTRGFGTITMTDPKSKKAVAAKGKYVMIFKKQSDGHWKGIIDTYNLDAAAK